MSAGPPAPGRAELLDASTPRGRFYRDAGWLHRFQEEVLATSWQPVPEASLLAGPGSLRPFTLLPGALDEPLLMVGTEGAPRCLSNVCTHRGALVVQECGRGEGLRCPYHGRRFDLRGRCLSAPGFEAVPAFPAERDHLPELPLEALGALWFTSLRPRAPLLSLLAPVLERVSFLPLERLRLLPESRKSYSVAAHFALYCENYLEGLHVPFVHASLARTLEWSGYRTLCLGRTSVQFGPAAEGEPALVPPPGHPEQGERIAAYWFFVFPNLLLNFYPWGLSLNVVVPLGVDRTRVDYAAFVLDESLLGHGAGGDLHRVELEDEAVVESAARGVRSRLYTGGRYSPSHEAAVLHFHRCLEEVLGPLDRGG